MKEEIKINSLNTNNTKYIGKNSALRTAMRDISNYIKESELKVRVDSWDTWIVTPSRIATQESLRLNRQLGLHKVEKTKERMSRFNC